MITARCHPALEPFLPKPTLARVPDWVKEMPSDVAADTLGGEVVRTLKHCPPFLDAMTYGVLVPLAVDLQISDQNVSWDWDPPHLPETLISRAPIGLHVPEQAAGSPIQLAVNSILKFMSFWTLEVPEGWSLLFTHPFNREDLPFRTLTGLVDCDLFRHGYVHFPALWTDVGFTGTLTAGTPVVQVIPVRRQQIALAIEPMTDAQIAENKRIQEALQDHTGVYRKQFRH